MKLLVARAALQRLDLYATRAPDFGIVEVFLDRQRIGAAIDGWAPAVLPSGAISLGQQRLEAGTHELSFLVRRKNPASTGSYLGIDAIALVPIAASS